MTKTVNIPPPQFLMPHAKAIMSIADEMGIKSESYNQGWIMRLSKGDKTQLIYGYKFPLNTMAGASTASDKAASSSIMKAHRISHIRSHLVINPTTTWAPKEGTWTWIHDYAAKHNLDIVVKPKDGTGGNGVYHTTNRLELENSLGKIFGNGDVLNATGRDAVICPYKPIAREIRVIMLNGVPEVIFEKFPPVVVGNGIKTTQALINDYLSRLTEKRAAIANSHIEPSLRMSTRVPAEGEKVQLHWKFNLGQGAEAVLLGGRAVHFARNEPCVEDESLKEIIDLAVKATRALDIKFGSADIVAVENEHNPMKKFRVMEVNSGVMMDNMKEQFADLGAKITDSVYREILKQMFP